MSRDLRGWAEDTAAIAAAGRALSLNAAASGMGLAVMPPLMARQINEAMKIEQMAEEAAVITGMTKEEALGVAREVHELSGGAREVAQLLAMMADKAAVGGASAEEVLTALRALDPKKIKRDLETVQIAEARCWDWHRRSEMFGRQFRVFR